MIDLSTITGFDVYWWMTSESPRLCRLATKSRTDIEMFSSDHVRFRAWPLEEADGDEVVIILRILDGQWVVKSDSFEDISHDYPIAFAESRGRGVWTDASEDELMVIQSTATG
jgi:hypothetical protein